MGITHSKVSSKADGTDSSLVRPSDWNADHVLETPLHVTSSGADAQTLFGKQYPTFSFLDIEDTESAASSSENTVGHHIHHKCKAGHIGGITALQCALEIAEAPSAAQNTVSLAANFLTVQTANVSTFTNFYLEGAASAALSQGPFTGAIAGHEIIAGASTGSSPVIKFDLLLTDFGPTVDTVKGSNWDAKLAISSIGGVGRDYGILFGAMSGSHPLSTNGTILGLSTGGTVANGVNLSNYTITGDAFKSPGFRVSGAGQAVAVSVEAPFYFVDNGGGVVGPTGAGQTFTVSAYDVDGAAYQNFITLTANNTPSCSLDRVTIAATSFAGLSTAPSAGMLAQITDSNTTTWGATIAGGGANRVLGWYNGSNWTVMGV